MNVPTFKEATENGEIVNKDGYHQPQNAHYRQRCGCKLTTPNGAYRDISVQMPNGMIVHFYHQTPVVAEKDGTYWVDNGGYETSSTKERINRYLPSGYHLYQEDYEWFLSSYDPNVAYDERETETLEFKRRMILEE